MTEPTIDPTGTISDAWAHLQTGVDVVIVCERREIAVDLFCQAGDQLGPVMARSSAALMRLLMSNGARLDVMTERQAKAQLRGRRCIVLFDNPIVTDAELYRFKALCEVGLNRPSEGT